MNRLRSLIAVAALAVALLALPARAEARVTVTVEVAYGAVVVGGVSIFVFIGGRWEAGLAARDIPTALVEVRDGRARLGVPLPLPRLAAEPGETAGAPGGAQADLFRLRF